RRKNPVAALLLPFVWTLEFLVLEFRVSVSRLSRRDRGRNLVHDLAKLFRDIVPPDLRGVAVVVEAADVADGPGGVDDGELRGLGAEARRRLAAGVEQGGEGAV